MRTRIVATSAVLAIALTALAPAALAGPRARRVASALIRSESSLQEISAAEDASALGAELTLAQRWLDDARSALRDGRDKRAEMLAQRLDAQIALLRAMLSAAGAETRADAAERAALALADRISELETRYDALALEARGAQLTSAFPEKTEATLAP